MMMMMMMMMTSNVYPSQMEPHRSVVGLGAHDAEHPGHQRQHGDEALVERPREEGLRGDEGELPEYKNQLPPASKGAVSIDSLWSIVPMRNNTP